MSSNAAVNLDELFQTAHEDGDLSAESLQTLNNIDLGAQIQAGLGIAAEDVQASEVVLVTMMPDDSASINFSGGKQAVIDGHNLVIESLDQSKQQDNILAHTRYLNGHVLYPYNQLASAIQMDSQNYTPNQATPLYDQTIVVLGTVLAKYQEFADNGVPARTVTLLITDGFDTSSTDPALVRQIVEDMLQQETHIIAAMGIGDDADFRQIFQEMGIRDEWILTPGNNESELRAAFQVFSQSAVQASQGGASFSQAALGGFGNRKLFSD